MIKLVKIGDKYAVRKGVLFHVYRDLIGSDYWHSKESEHFYDCLGSESCATAEYERLTAYRNKEEVIK